MITTTLRSSLAVVAVLSIAACTSDQPKNSHDPAKPAENSGVATVRATGGGVGNFFAMVLKPVGETRNFEIKKINGEDAKAYGGSRQVNLTPGHYNIDVLCGFNIDNQLVYLDGTIAADLSADHRYEITGDLPADRSQKCVARIVDITQPGG
jgi:hypothetical protein